MPGRADHTISPASLLGEGRREVRIDDGKGGATVYRGLPLLEVLEEVGLDSKNMDAARKTAAAIVQAVGRDGYAVVFSVGELLAHRGDPRVYLAAATASGSLSERDGPMRLVVVGERARSAYGLARIELKFVAENGPTPSK
jgi:hypothetical protein